MEAVYSHCVWSLSNWVTVKHVRATWTVSYTLWRPSQCQPTKQGTRYTCEWLRWRSELRIVIFCVAVLLQSVLCEKCCHHPKVCVRFLYKCIPERRVLTTLRLLRRCLLLCPCVDSSGNLRIKTPCRQSRLGCVCTMMLAQDRTHALQCSIIISSEVVVAVVHFWCTYLHFGACACLLAECDQVIPEYHQNVTFCVGSVASN